MSYIEHVANEVKVFGKEITPFSSTKLRKTMLISNKSQYLRGKLLIQKLSKAINKTKYLEIQISLL